MKNFYDILGVSQNASNEEIKKRFRYLAQAYHPDKFASDKDKQRAEQDFKDISAAYQVLSSPEKRAEYDRGQSTSKAYHETNKQTDPKNNKQGSTRPSTGEKTSRTSQPKTNKTSKKNKKSAKQRAAEEARKRRNVQLIASSVIVLILIALVWAFWSKSEASDTASVDPASVDAVSVPDVKQLQYDAPPPMTIDVSKEYFAAVKMAKGGEFVIQLYPDKAPITVNNFVFLAREGFYDGTTFHRVLPDFMAQGGDPTGTGGGDPGYEFQNEDSDLTFDKAGVVAMANAGRDTNGSQFFITFGPQEYLNGGYTIFGQVIEGMDVVMSIRLRDPQQNPSFEGDAILSVTIEEK